MKGNCQSPITLRKEQMLNLIGFLLPAMIDLINRRIKDTDIRFWVSVLICVLVGSVLGTLESNGFEGLSLTEVAELLAVKSMAMFGMAQLSYKKVWENSILRDDLSLNAKTLK